MEAKALAKYDWELLNNKIEHDELVEIMNIKIQDAINKKKDYTNFKSRIDAYKAEYKSKCKKEIKNEDKYVFILDEKMSFDLPYPVIFPTSYGNNGNPENHVFLSLKDMLAKPVNGVVTLSNLSKNRK